LMDNIDVFEVWCYEKSVKISYNNHMMNEEALDTVEQREL